MAPSVRARRTARVAAGPELALEQQVELGQGQRPEQERLVGAGEPGDRRVVVEVGAVGGGEDRRAVEQDGHARAAVSGGAAGPAAGLASGDAPPVERQPAVGALADAR